MNAFNQLLKENHQKKLMVGQFKQEHVESFIADRRTVVIEAAET
jgi:hypothetical protein